MRPDIDLISKCNDRARIPMIMEFEAKQTALVSLVDDDIRDEEGDSAVSLTIQNKRLVCRDEYETRKSLGSY